MQMLKKIVSMTSRATLIGRIIIKARGGRQSHSYDSRIN